MRTPEGRVKDKVKEFFTARGIASLSKPDPNAVGYYHMFVPMGYGSPLLDFTVCYKGRFLLVETKSRGNKPTARQLLIKHGVARAGGLVIIDNDWDALKLKLEGFFDAVDCGRLDMNETDPNGKSASEPGSKLDANKDPIFRGVIDYFPRAVAEVSAVSSYGATKYTWGGWKTVPNGINRYTDALCRHLVAESREGPVDHETQLLHAAQVAWNALARLELMLAK